MSTVVVSAPISNKPTHVSGRAGRVLYWTIRRKYPDAKLYWIPDKKSIHEYAPILQKLAARDSVLFAYFGHGKRERICGQIPPHCGRDKGGFVDEENVDVLNGIITYALCCWTSHTFGRVAEESGALSYVGFRKPVFVGFSMEERNYRDDIVNIWNTFPLQMLEGNTVAGAISEMGSKSMEYENYYDRHKDDLLYGDYYFRRFKSNRTALVPFGDVQATLV